MNRIAINGCGRIGRLFLRQVLNNPQMKVVAINDLGEIENLAYLLRHDSVYRNLDEEVEVLDNKLRVGRREMVVLSEKEPTNLPWRELEVDLVIEATGVFTSFAQAKVHLGAGAGRVVITAPAKDEEGTEGGRTVLMGINEAELKNTNLTCNGSCTTNAAGPVIQVLHEKLGIKKSILTTVHGYTSSQSLMDVAVRPGKDVRRGRAAAENIVPSTTGAAIAVTRVIPDLEKKFDGVAMRVPVPAGSLVDITMMVNKETTREGVNQILREASRSERWQGILEMTDEPLVSSDIIGRSVGSLVDTSFTKVVDGDLVKVLAWYDNEWGYVSTLVRHAERALGW